MAEEEVGSSSKAIDSSNVGFQLLKKCGWKEGTGLGVLEQGRLEPLQPHVKKNKRGLGAEKEKQKAQLPDGSRPGKQNDNVHLQSRKKLKSASKRLRKMQEEEERRKERIRTSFFQGVLARQCLKHSWRQFLANKLMRME